MKLEEYLKVIEKWLKDMLDTTHMDGYVLGVSGGIDSAVVALLAKRSVGDKLFCVILPCYSDPKDSIDAKELLETHNIPYVEIDLSSTYYSIMNEIKSKYGEDISHLASINTKVRLRMVTLYTIAQSRNSLVLGTDNWDESYTGYFTKYGDGGVDLLPIVNLTKGEVFEAGRILGVNESIMKRKPSAGLYANQTDETEMGVTYDELDRYLLGEKIDDEKVKRIEHLHRVSAHKREPLPRPSEYKRD